MEAVLNTTFQISMENEEIEFGTIQFLGILVFILLIFGNCLILGIIHYEKFGQDPQKRSFPDQIITDSICWNAIIVSFINAIILEFRSLFGTVGHFWAVVVYFLRAISSIVNPLALAECIVFRCIMIFCWKRVAMIDDKFLSKFSNSFNRLVGICFACIQYMTGQFYHEGYIILSGDKTQDIRKRNRYIYPIFMIFLVTICSIGVLAIRIKKHIEHKKDEKISIDSFLQTQRVSVPVIDAIDNDEQANCLNNHRWNKQLLSFPFVTIVALLFFIMAFILPFLKKNLDGQEMLQLKDNIIQILLNVILPLMVYVKNDKILKHLRSEFNF